MSSGLQASPIPLPRSSKTWPRSSKSLTASATAKNEQLALNKADNVDYHKAEEILQNTMKLVLNMARLEMEL